MVLLTVKLIHSKTLDIVIEFKPLIIGCDTTAVFCRLSVYYSSPVEWATGVTDDCWDEPLTEGEEDEIAEAESAVTIYTQMMLYMHVQIVTVWAKAHLV